MTKILTVGNSTQDIFINHEEPILNTDLKVDVKKVYYAQGGGAFNSAISFKRLGLHAVPLSKVGYDQAGAQIISKLKSFNIPTEYIIKTKKFSTSTSFITYTAGITYNSDINTNNNTNSAHVTYCHRGAGEYLNLNKVNINLTEFNYIYITSLSQYSTNQLDTFLKKAKKHNINITLNPGANQLINSSIDIYNSLQNIDTLILNLSEAKLFIKSLINLKLINFNNYIIKEDYQTFLKAFFNLILKLGPKVVVITNSSQGAYIATKNFIISHPSIQTDIVNTLGAGDAFGSCFVSCTALNKSIEKSLIYSLINSSSVISYLDTTTGLLNLDTLEKKFKRIGTKSIRKLK